MGKYLEQLRKECSGKSKEELIEALDIAYMLIDDRDRLFEFIPACPEHGKNCTPHAIEWLKSLQRDPH